VATSRRRQGFGPVLKNRRLVALWLGQAVSNFGDALARIALIILITDRTRSPVALSLLMASQAVPMVLLGPFIGVLVDRWDKKRVMIAADLLRSACALLLMLGPPLTVIYAVAVAVVTLSLFFMPARSTAIVEIVGREQYLSAVSLSQSTFHALNLIGPAIGGALIGLFGAAAAFGINAATFGVSAVVTLAVPFPPLPRAQRRASAAEYWASLREGLGFLRQDQRLWFLVRFFGPAAAGLGLAGLLLLNYVRNDLALPPAEFGLIQSVEAFGMLAATLAIGQFGSAWPRGRMIFDGFLVAGLLIAAFIFNPGFYPLLAMLGLFGLALGFVQLPVSALFGVLTPVDKRGRVFATTNSLIQVANLVGYAAAGAVASFMSTGVALGLAGGVVVVASLALRRDPAYRLLNAADTAPESEAAASSGPAARAGSPASE